MATTAQTEKTSAAAAAIINTLASMHGVEAPDLHVAIGGSPRTGQFSPPRAARHPFLALERPTITVFISDRHWQFPTTVAHEFQHYIDWLHGITVSNPDHGQEFYMRLDQETWLPYLRLAA